MWPAFSMRRAASLQPRLSSGRLSHANHSGSYAYLLQSLHHARRVHARASGLEACGHPGARAASSRGISEAHVAVRQRISSASDLEHNGQSHRHPAATTAASDDSIKIIMLLSLSLTLMLLPWISKHPEFLVVPAVLAITPVVGNGVRPVLKEVISGLLATLRLSFGILAHQEQHQLSSHHSHDSHHHHHSSQHTHHHHNPSHQNPHNVHQHQQPAVPQGPYSRVPKQQHPAPAGPHSPWPNPSQLPASWPPASREAATRARSADADSDWAPSSPPDLHHLDPHSHQHLQQVLAADKQVEWELGQVNGPTGYPHHQDSSRGRSGHSSNSTSPSGSPNSSMDAHQHGESSAEGSTPGHRHAHHQHHVKDPRMLSKEAKQQLYHLHHQQHQAAATQQRRPAVR